MKPTVLRRANFKACCIPARTILDYARVAICELGARLFARFGRVHDSDRTAAWPAI